jgi:hypothetical protein
MNLQWPTLAKRAKVGHPSEIPMVLLAEGLTFNCFHYLVGWTLFGGSFMERLKISQLLAVLLSTASGAVSMLALRVMSTTEMANRRFVVIASILLWLAGACFGLLATRNGNKALRIVGFVELIICAVYAGILLFASTRGLG